MDESEGLQLLYNKLHNPPDKDSTIELLRALNYIPLAITQAAAYISRRARMTVKRYLDKFRRNDKKRESLLNWDTGELRRDESASNSVVITWQMSFEQIRRERPSAAELLSLMSYFNPQGIPESTLRRYSREAARVLELDDNEEVDSAFEEDLDTLQAYSLVSITADNDVCEMHALVQFCTQVWLSSFSDVAQWEQKFVVLMAQELPEGKYKNWAKCQQLLPHVERLFNSEPPTKGGLISWSDVLTNAARYLSMRGTYSIAQEIAAKALAAREQVAGLDNQRKLVNMEVLAFVLRSQGGYDEAEKLYRRALEGFEKELGEQHPDTLASVNNLALVLQAQGKYDEAEKLSRRALEGSEKELGVQHPNSLTSAYCLAYLLHSLQQYREAAELYRRACDGYAQELGSQHPTTVACYKQFAAIQ